jgi:hypothetical protein
VARPRRVISMEERRALLLRRSELSTLAQLPNWDVYCAVIEQEIEDIKRVVMGKAMGPGISLEEQAYQRGRVIGLRAARSIPARALDKELTESSPRQEEVVGE